MASGEQLKQKNFERLAVNMATTAIKNVSNGGSFLTESK